MAASLDRQGCPRVTSFDFATYPDQFPLGPTDAVIVQAHTGVKSYSALALQRAVDAGVPVISIGSETAEHPGSRLILRTCEREKSAAYTSSHLCAMARLAQLAVSLGSEQLREPLMALPDQIAGVIAREAEIEPVARDAADRHIYAIGAGPNEPTALEFVIKAREAALQPCDGLGLEQFFHGPIVAVNAGDFGLVISVTAHRPDRTAAIAKALGMIGLAIWSTGDADPEVPGGTHFALPSTHELISPLLTVVPDPDLRLLPGRDPGHPPRSLPPRRSGLRRRLRPADALGVPAWTTIDARQQATQTYQTIHYQPDDLRTMFARERDRIAEAAHLLGDASRVLTIGIGSSHHASQVSAWLLRAAGIDALPIHAFDFLHYPEQYPIRPGDAAIIFGHTGSTTFTRQALEQLVVEGVPVIAVGATTAEHHGARVFLRTTEPETFDHLHQFAPLRDGGHRPGRGGDRRELRAGARGPAAARSS